MAEKRERDNQAITERVETESLPQNSSRDITDVLRAAQVRV